MLRTLKEDETPTERLLQSFNVGLSEKWNMQRFDILCVKLNYTRYEVAQMVGMNRQDLSRVARSNRFPIPACKMLNMVDRFTDKKRGLPLEPCPWEDFINER